MIGVLKLVWQRPGKSLEVSAYVYQARICVFYVSPSFYTLEKLKFLLGGFNNYFKIKPTPIKIA